VTTTHETIANDRVAGTEPEGLPPWQFFLLCGMLGATAVVIVATGQTLSNIIVLSLTVLATSFVGLGAYRMLAPLVSRAPITPPTLMGGRTRAALEREKFLVLRSIKELEFDFAMGKMSKADFDEMGGRLRARAMGLMRQLDAGSGYRAEIEREIEARVAQVAVPPQKARASAPPPVPARASSTTCATCGTANDLDARFCKLCGSSLAS
jgi:hypothetical protein